MGDGKIRPEDVKVADEPVAKFPTKKAAEHAAKEALPPADGRAWLRMCDERRWGDTAISFFEPADVPGPSAEPA
jgi:hypothetical protein